LIVNEMILIEFFSWFQWFISSFIIYQGCFSRHHDNSENNLFIIDNFWFFDVFNSIMIIIMIMFELFLDIPSIDEFVNYINSQSFNQLFETRSSWFLTECYQSNSPVQID
jgi:hypothetical protein